MWEAGEALSLAARDEDKRLLADPRVASMVSRLPRTGTLGLIVNGPMLYPALYDGVRDWATDRMGIADERARMAKIYRAQKKSEDELGRLVDQRIGPWKQNEYERLREQYEELLTPLRSIDGLGLVVSLGVGPENKIKAEGVLLLTGDEEPEGDNDPLESGGDE